VRNQDDELNARIRRAGGRIWQSPAIRSWYFCRSSLLMLWRQYMQYGYWKVRVIRKLGQPASIRHLAPAAFVSALAFGALVGPFSPAVSRALGLMVGSYAIALACASAITAARGGMQLLPLLPVVFACYHLAYGFGFLCGVWDAIVGGRISAFSTRLTRPSGPPPI
jgi:hypothetical protein